MEGPEIQFSEAVIDNGRFGKRVIRFETGRLAKQAAGAAMVYIDEETALLSATTAGKPLSPTDFTLALSSRLSMNFFYPIPLTAVH